MMDERFYLRIQIDHQQTGDHSYQTVGHLIELLKSIVMYRQYITPIALKLVNQNRKRKMLSGFIFT